VLNVDMRKGGAHIGSEKGGVITLSGDLIPVFLREVIFGFHYLLKHLWHRLRVEWREPAQSAAPHKLRK